MKETVGDACKVKAAGGVRNKEQFEWESNKGN